jgi:sugar phosphate isomerase/epimerase
MRIGLVTDGLPAQWTEQLIPYWIGLAAEARAAGVERLCLELHGQQNVFNVRTLFRLRDAVGPMVGANLDPSHLIRMGADRLAAVPVLGRQFIMFTPRIPAST